MSVESYQAAQVQYDPLWGRTTKWFDGGMGILYDGGGYTETHLIHVEAFDAAGNEVKSPPVRVYVIHKKDKERESAVPHVALIWPVRRRENEIDALPGARSIWREFR